MRPPLEQPQCHRPLKASPVAAVRLQQGHCGAQYAARIQVCLRYTARTLGGAHEDLFLIHVSWRSAPQRSTYQCGGREKVHACMVHLKT